MGGLTVAGTCFTPDDIAELVNNYHVARAAVGDNRGDRMRWAAEWFEKQHGVKAIRAYKALDRALA